MLLAQGFYNGTVDGIDGPMTRAAIASFRARYELPVDAGMDWEFLQQLGLSGFVIGRVQEALSKLGFYRGPITRELDALTSAAIRSYQVSENMAADGDIDDQLLVSLSITS